MSNEFTEENFQILFDEEVNVVEIRYQGVNAALLAALQQQVNDLEDDLADAIGGANGQLGQLENDLDSLSTLIQVMGNDLEDEAAIRLASDTLLGNETLAVTDELADAIEEEATTRAAALIQEAEDRNAAIASANAIIVTDVAALAISVTGLATDMGTAEAAIIEVNEALSTEVAARSAQYSAILADFGDTNAAVLEESVARADADTALAYLITAIEADVDGVSAAVVAESLARASADSALAADISTVSASVGTVAASVTAEASARASADSALSTSISSVSTTVAGHTSSISSQATSISGIQAKYSLRLDVNGRITGYEVIGTGVGTDFIIRADTFKIYDGSSDIAPFSVSGGVVTMSNVAVTGSLTITNTVQSFTPTWTGFTTPPTGDMYYIDLGAIVVLWNTTYQWGFATSLGMTITNLPAGIRPSGQRYIQCTVENQGLFEAGVVQVTSGGGLLFGVYDTSSGLVDLSATGSKGLPSGFTIIYPK